MFSRSPNFVLFSNAIFQRFSAGVLIVSRPMMLLLVPRPAFTYLAAALVATYPATFAAPPQSAADPATLVSPALSTQTKLMPEGTLDVPTGLNTGRSAVALPFAFASVPFNSVTGCP